MRDVGHDCTGHMKICAQCGATLQNNADTCPACGKQQLDQVSVNDGPSKSHPIGSAQKRDDTLGDRMLDGGIMVLMFAAPLIFGFLGFHFFGPTGAVVGALFGFLLFGFGFP